MAALSICIWLSVTQVYADYEARKLNYFYPVLDENGAITSYDTNNTTRVVSLIFSTTTVDELNDIYKEIACETPNWRCNCYLESDVEAGKYAIESTNGRQIDDLSVLGVAQKEL